MVSSSDVRRGRRKHAFEDALDDVRFDADGMPVTDETFDDFNPGPGRGIGSFGDVSVAAGYVARPSLQRAYDHDTEAGRERDEGLEDALSGAIARPAEAALKLIAELASGAFTIKQLAQLRRLFASANHPDRVPVAQREEAARAMADVNAAIDLALKRVRRT